MTTGDKIAQERKKINLTQEQLAYMLGVTRQAVSRWEADVAYPETEKLIKLSSIFGCSVDYLLTDSAQREQTDAVSPGEEHKNNVGKFGSGIRLSDIYYEYKSERTLFGMPLVHINLGLDRTAKGFIAIGIRAKGIVSLGIFSMGVFALGVFSLGIFALGSFALALIAAFGAVAAGLIAGGAVAVGFVAFGAVAIGAFANGAYAVGGYVAAGDRAYGIVAIGKSSAQGDYAFILKEQNGFQLLSAEIDAAVDAAVPEVMRWLGHICASFGKIMLGG